MIGDASRPEATSSVKYFPQNAPVKLRVKTFLLRRAAASAATGPHRALPTKASKSCDSASWTIGTPPAGANAVGAQSRKGVAATSDSDALKRIWRAPPTVGPTWAVTTGAGFGAGANIVRVVVVSTRGEH